MIIDNATDAGMFKMQNSNSFPGMMLPGFGGLTADALILQSQQLMLNSLTGVQNKGQNVDKENKAPTPVGFLVQPSLLDSNYAALAAQLNLGAQGYGFLPFQAFTAGQGNVDVSKNLLSNLQFGAFPAVAPVYCNDDLLKNKKRLQTMKTERKGLHDGEKAEVTKTTKKRRRVTVKLCHVDGCSKLARSTTLYCAAHGGGRRCMTPGCTKAARGATNFCIAHGGGRRCRHPTCAKSAQGSTHFCIAHGGGRRCRNPNCTKSARGPAGFCKAHGGGKKCEHPSCSKSAAENSSFCRPHGGGMKCSVEDCPRAVRKNQEYCAEHDDAQKVFPGTATVVPFSSINAGDVDLKKKDEKVKST